MSNDLVSQDGIELTKEQLMMVYKTPEAKERFKKDPDERINKWCEETFKKLGTENSLKLFQPLFASVENMDWNILNEEDKTICKKAMERLIVIFDSEYQPLLSDDGFDEVDAELYKELGLE